MAIDGRTLSPWTPIYTFVANDGTNVRIHATKLREHCLALSYKSVLVPVDVPLARSFVRDNVVDMCRVTQLTDENLREPIILCKTEAFGKNHPVIPDTLLVDGHHRFVRNAMDGQRIIAAWLLEFYQWSPFMISNVPDTTRATLKAEPILPKPHWKNP